MNKTIKLICLLQFCSSEKCKKIGGDSYSCKHTMGCFFDDSFDVNFCTPCKRASGDYSVSVCANKSTLTCTNVINDCQAEHCSALINTQTKKECNLYGCTFNGKSCGPAYSTIFVLMFVLVLVFLIIFSVLIVYCFYKKLDESSSSEEEIDSESRGCFQLLGKWIDYEFLVYIVLAFMFFFLILCFIFMGLAMDEKKSRYEALYTKYDCEHLPSIVWENNRYYQSHPFCRNFKNKFISVIQFVMFNDEMDAFLLISCIFFTLFRLCAVIHIAVAEGSGWSSTRTSSSSMRPTRACAFSRHCTSLCLGCSSTADYSGSPGGWINFLVTIL